MGARVQLRLGKWGSLATCLFIAATLAACNEGSSSQSSANSTPAQADASNPPPNHPPTISGTPATSVVAGSGYAFTPTANDQDGDALSFSIQNTPAWATFSASTGKLSGTPSSGQVGSYSNIIIAVSDGKATTSLPAFAITVTAASPGAPTISGTPGTTVTAGQAYSFQPAASGAAGGTLIFSIQNKPSWATFNTSSGLLAGTPAASDAGTTSNIVISVSDGTRSASLTAFSITVNQISNGSAVLNWSAPTLNVDGSALTTLAGYHILYGNAANALTQTIQVANPTVTTYTVPNLSSGTWYFSVEAYLADGTTSSASNPVSVVIP
jgi:Putative Ig domain